MRDLDMTSPRKFPGSVWCPGVLRVRVRVIKYVSWVWGLCSVVGLFVGAATARSWDPAVRVWVARAGWTWLALTVALLVSYFWYRIGMKRAQGLSRRSSYAICWECLYDLGTRGDDAGGACPECGQIYQFTELRRRWVKFGKAWL